MIDEAAERGSATSREWDADAYHRLSEPQFAWGLRVLERLPLRGDERLLDAGCGSGRLTRELVRRRQRGFVVGCDLSENMTHAAAATLGARTDCAIVCADLCRLPLGDGVFDAVFSTATFHWVLDHDILFRELRRVLRAQGRLEAQCGGGANLDVVHARASGLAAEGRYRDYFVDWRDPWLFASPADTEARLRHAGFRSASCWLEHAPTPFPDAGRYRAFLESVVMRPYLARLPEGALRTNFLDDLMGEAARDDPPLTLDYWRLNISATA
jgi:trans-aconitate methyltransferase